MIEKTDTLLSQPLVALAEGEARGWRPSLIFSPLIVEEGRQMLISNLDLGQQSGGLEFAKIFPAATGFTVATAVRMSAAFPYVTPAVSLPTTPPKRIVDAGYLDNYGTTTAAQWIQNHKDWLLLNTNGVVWIQLKAYTPSETSDKTKTFADRISSALEPFTTPAQAFFTKDAQLVKERDQAMIDQLRYDLNEEKNGRKDFFYPVELSPPQESQVPMSWVLTEADAKQLRDGLCKKVPLVLTDSIGKKQERLESVSDKIDAMISTVKKRDEKVLGAPKK